MKSIYFNLHFYFKALIIELNNNLYYIYDSIWLTNHFPYFTSCCFCSSLSISALSSMGSSTCIMALSLGCSFISKGAGAPPAVAEDYITWELCLAFAVPVTSSGEGHAPSFCFVPCLGYIFSFESSIELSLLCSLKPDGRPLCVFPTFSELGESFDDFLL